MAIETQFEIINLFQMMKFFFTLKLLESFDFLSVVFKDVVVFFRRYLRSVFTKITSVVGYPCHPLLGISYLRLGQRLNRS